MTIKINILFIVKSILSPPCLFSSSNLHSNIHWCDRQEQSVPDCWFSLSTISDISILVWPNDDDHSSDGIAYPCAKIDDNTWDWFHSFCLDVRNQDARQNYLFSLRQPPARWLLMLHSKWTDWKKVTVTIRHRDACCQHPKWSSEMAWKIKKMTHAGTAAALLSTFRFLRRWEQRGRSAHSQVGSGRSRWCPTQTPSPPRERWLQEAAGDTSPLWRKVKKLVIAERMLSFMTFYNTVISHFRIMAGWQLCNNILAE